jgi:hypothetical protein
MIVDHRAESFRIDEFGVFLGSVERAAASSHTLVNEVRGDALPRDASSDYSSKENGGKYAETSPQHHALGSRCSAA